MIWPRLVRELPDSRTKGWDLEGWSSNGSATDFISMKNSTRDVSRATFGLLPDIYTEKSGFSSKGSLLCGILSLAWDLLTRIKFVTCLEMIWNWKGRIKQKKLSAVGDVCQNSQIHHMMKFHIH